MEVFRSQVHPDVLANEIMTFLIVADGDPEPVPLADIKNTLSISQSATSRNINFLGQHGANERAGQHLVMTTENPENRRAKLAILTPKGKSLKRQLENILENGRRYEAA